MIPELIISDSTDFPDRIKVSIGDQSEFYNITRKGDCHICGKETNQIMREWNNGKVIDYCKGCYNGLKH